MKLLASIKKYLTVDLEKRGEVVEVEKRDGVFVSRPVLLSNAKKWRAWGERHGIPNLLAPEEMHVTLLYSKVDVKVPLLETTMNLRTVGDGYCGGACFAMFGNDEDHLVITFANWELQDRHWALLAAGGVSDWPSYRPHMTIASDVAGFELSDEALADVPAWIILGPEENADIKVKTAMAPSESLLQVSEEMKAAAQGLIDSPAAGMSVIDASDLKDVTKGRFPIEVQKRLTEADWAPDVLKTASAVVVPPVIITKDGRHFIERDVTMTVGSIPEDVRKKAGAIIDSFKTNEEEKLAYGWASVSTVKGEFVEDLQGDTITTKAQREWLHDLIRSQRIGKMDHVGDQVGEVVEGIVLDKALQDALGIDLGLEGCLVCTHYTCEKTWDMVKTGDWMYSIAGRVLVEVEEGKVS